MYNQDQSLLTFKFCNSTLNISNFTWCHPNFNQIEKVCQSLNPKSRASIKNTYPFERQLGLGRRTALLGGTGDGSFGKSPLQKALDTNNGFSRSRKCSNLCENSVKEHPENWSHFYDLEGVNEFTLNSVEITDIIRYSFKVKYQKLDFFTEPATWTSKTLEDSKIFQTSPIPLIVSKYKLIDSINSSITIEFETIPKSVKIDYINLKFRYIKRCEKECGKQFIKTKWFSVDRFDVKNVENRDGFYIVNLDDLGEYRPGPKIRKFLEGKEIEKLAERDYNIFLPVKSEFQVKFQAVSESSSDSVDVKKLTTEFTSALPNVGQFSTYKRTVKIGNLQLIMIIGGVISSLIVLLCVSSIYFRRANIASQKRFNNQLKIIGLDDKCQELPFIKRKSIKLGREIGQGHFGAVYKAVLDKHGAQNKDRAVVAAKELRRDDFGKDNYNKNIRYTRPPTNSEGANYRRRSSANERITRRIFQEASLEAVMHYRSCGKINHCNIVKFHGYSIDFEASQIHFYLISEYCNSGDLSNFLKKEYADWGLEDKTSRSDKIDTCLFMSIAAQVASACSHLISQKIVHRDLAVRNVMVNMSGMSMNTSVSDINLHESRTRTIFNKNYRKIGELHSRMNFLQMFHVKLSDFGLAREMNYPRQTENNKGPDRFYKCPIEESLLPTHSLPWDINEVMSNKERGWTEKVEVWAYGVLLWEISSCGRVPKPMRDRTLGKHHLCSDDCYDLMKVCWKKSERERPNFQEIFKNASVKRDKLLSRLEQYVFYLEKKAMGAETGIDNECLDNSFENSDDFEMIRRTSALEHGVRISQIGSVPEGDFTPLGVANRMSVGEYQESSVFDCETEEDEELFERPENQIRRDSKIGYVQVLATLKEESKVSEGSDSVFYRNKCEHENSGYDNVAEYDENDDNTDREPPYQFTDPNTGRVYREL